MSNKTSLNPKPEVYAIPRAHPNLPRGTYAIYPLGNTLFLKIGGANPINLTTLTDTLNVGEPLYLDNGELKFRETLQSDFVVEGGNQVRFGNPSSQNTNPTTFGFLVGSDRLVSLEAQNNSLVIKSEDASENDVFKITMDETGGTIENAPSNAKFTFDANGLLLEQITGGSPTKIRLMGTAQAGEESLASQEFVNTLNNTAAVQVKPVTSMPTGAELFRTTESNKTIIHLLENTDGSPITAAIPQLDPNSIASTKFTPGTGLHIPLYSNSAGLDNISSFINGSVPDLATLGTVELIIGASLNTLSVVATPITVLDASTLTISHDFSDTGRVFQDIPVQVVAADVTGGTEGASTVTWYTHSTATKDKNSPQSAVATGADWRPPTGAAHKYAHCVYDLKDQSGTTVKQIESAVITFNVVSVIANDLTVENGSTGVLQGFSKGFDNSAMDVLSETVDGATRTVQEITVNGSNGILETDNSYAVNTEFVIRYYFNVQTGKTHRFGQLSFSGTFNNSSGNSAYQKIESTFTSAGTDELFWALTGSAHTNVSHKISFLSVLQILD